MGHFTLTFIGGTTEIGGNFTLINFNKKNILIDAGIKFPKGDNVGINCIIPNLDEIDSIDTIIITHGHEDHIGAIWQVLLKFPDATIYAPKVPALLMEWKLKEFPLPYNLIVYREEIIELPGDIIFEPIKIYHSIPDAYGVLLHIDEVSMYFCSDFTFAHPIEENIQSLADSINDKIGADRKSIFCLDSTSIYSKNLPASIEEIEKTFRKAISGDYKRCFFVLFPSNILRLKLIIDLANEYKKKIGSIGASAVNFVETGKAAGVIPNYCEVLRDSQTADVFLVSGSQADIYSGFFRLVNPQDPYVTLDDKDCVIYSAKAIPGNEHNVSQALNKAVASGAKVITSFEEITHASGHASRPLLESFYDKINPSIVIPIHGESLFVDAHSRILEARGVKTLKAINNNSFTFSSKDLTLLSKEMITFNDTYYLNKHTTIDKKEINQRRKLARNGVLFITCLRSYKTCDITVSITSQGIPPFDHEELKNKILKYVITNWSDDEERFSSEVKHTVKRFFSSSLSARPEVILHKEQL